MMRSSYLFYTVVVLSTLRFGYLQSVIASPNTLENIIADVDYAAEQSCCNYSFENIASNNEGYLWTYLEALKAQDFTQFERECQEQTFAFTEFTELVYLRFCNRSEMERKCNDDLRKIIELRELSTWNDIIQNLNILFIKDEDLINPCLQIAMLDKASVTQSRFHEMIALVPFCSVIWCGFDEVLFNEKDVTVWTCIPTKCRAKVIVIFIVCGILAFATALCNVSVLGVLCINKNLRNGQAVYRMSLAFSDLMVGIIIFPTFIYTLYQNLHIRPNLGNINDSKRNSSGNASHAATDNVTEIQLPQFPLALPQSYFDTIGFFISMLLIVSIYTLVAAATDRLMAVYRPLKYRRAAAISAAQRAVVVMWVSAITFSLLPIFISDLNYSLVFAMLIGSSGGESTLIYSIAIVVPILLMWTITAATFIFYKIYSRKRRSLNYTDQRRKEAAFQNHLLFTLGAMVGVFTICFLPGEIFLIVHSIILPVNASISDLLRDLGQSFIKHVSAEVVISLFLTSNSLWNFFIYSARDQTFRTATKKMYLQLFSGLNCKKLKIQELSGTALSWL